jgi:hypothetical protein
MCKTFVLQLSVMHSALMAVTLCGGFYSAAPAQDIFSDDFNGFTAPAANFNGGQLGTAHPVAFSGDLPDWAKAGGGTVHIVDHANVILPPSDASIMFFQDNVITLDAAIAGSNANGTNYTVSYLASPAVYAVEVQASQAGDELLIEVLRGDDSVLASHVYEPGAWAGDMAFVADNFQYQGDGSGNIRLRIGPNGPLSSGRFEGAIDDITITNGGQIFSESFSSIPTVNVQPKSQFQSGRDLGFSGNIDGWSESGAGTAHVAFGQASEPTTNPQDFAVMIFADNVITLNTPIADSNASGQPYQVSFDASPAVYQAGSQVTTAADALLIEVLRADDSVLSSHTVMPGDWAGAIDFAPAKFTYVGDGSGDIRLRVGSADSLSGRFAGAIDNLNVAVVPEPGSLALAALAMALVSLNRRPTGAAANSAN